MLQRVTPRSLQSRLLLTYLVLLFLGLGGLIVWAGLRLQGAAIEQAEHELELEALLIANAFQEPIEAWQEVETDEGRSLDIDTLAHSYAQRIGARVTVVNSDLRVLASSDAAVLGQIEHNHPEIVAAQAHQEQHDIRWDEWRNEERLFVAAPITEEAGEIDGVLQLSVPMAPIHSDIRRTWLNLIGVGGAILVVTAIASLLLARQVASPIQHLTSVTEAVAAGDLEQRVTPAGPDEVQRLGQAFNRMAGQLREVLARQQAFVANAAHELRSPLTSIRLRIEMIQQHGQSKPELAERYLGQMEQEVGHLQRLIDHLLTLSKVEAAQERPASSIDLAPLLYDLADEMGPLAGAAGMELQIDVPAHLPPVLADPDPMRMVIRNLLDNAIKYSQSGGEITLKAMTAHEVGESAKGSMPAARSGTGAVIIQVSDTGPGIPEEHLPHIFDRFYRVDKRRPRSEGGAGLGLSLVRSIVETHGGEVCVESEAGEGATFEVHLPQTS
ncbi:MAG: Signal transduction histidine-protein kinase BaeS [Anaerolineales bacterium]|nr:Signal transduction histidine-protein kinase BaeS [Anaerolineales bacterium]